MTEAYPEEVRELAGEDVQDGVPAPGAPQDPERVAEDGGMGTGDLDPPQT
jgi:hypothetical protein